MTWLYLLLALAIAWLPAQVWLERLVPAGLAGRRGLVGAYALLLGMLGTTLLMRLLSLLQVGFSVYSIGAAAAVLTVAGLAAPARWRVPGTTLLHPGESTAGRACSLLLGLLLVLLVGRLLALGLEVGTRPLFAWDAKQHWTRQARVFYQWGSVVPYVSLQEWLQRGGDGVYTNMHPGYPIATPLLQAFVATVLGRWDDSLVNLPWVVTWVALGWVCYFQSRLAGAGRLTALAAVYMLLSLPYLNIQVALAGYADLLLGACYLAAVAAFYQWSQCRESWQLVLAGLAAGACLLVKNEGLFWCLSFLPGLLAAQPLSRRSLFFLGLLAANGLLVLYLLPHDLVVAEQSLESLKLGYRPESWQPIYLSFFVHDNWHLLAYVFFALLLAMPLGAASALPGLLPVLSVIGSALAMYFALYLLTHHAYGAVYFTSLNRVALQLMPAVGFVSLLMFLRLTGVAIPGDGVPATKLNGGNSARGH